MTDDPDTAPTVELRLEHDRIGLGPASPSRTQDGPDMLSDVRPIRHALLDRGGPGSAELEQAIGMIEDLIMPLLRHRPRPARLVVSGPELESVLKLIAHREGEAVSVESIEDLFNQLADRVSGSPTAWRHPVPPEALAMGLTVLREVMHHGAFSSVCSAPAPSGHRP